jgi:hypothetical protein
MPSGPDVPIHPAPGSSIICTDAITATEACREARSSSSGSTASHTLPTGQRGRCEPGCFDSGEQPCLPAERRQNTRAMGGHHVRLVQT